jgi:hypothetical protein
MAKKADIQKLPKPEAESTPSPPPGGSVASAAKDAGQSAEPWVLPAMNSNTTRLVLLALVMVVNIPLIHYFVFRSAPKSVENLPVQDDFSSEEKLRTSYSSTGGQWRLVNGELLSPGVKNNPLWLKASLPQNVAVEFDAKSTSPEGDIKCEIFGDGTDHASGYVLIHGGWNNQISVMARLDEHGPALPVVMAAAQARGGDLVSSGVYRNDTRVRVEGQPFPVVIGQSEHWRIERRGGLIVWSINNKEFLRFDDPLPLTGKGHDRFGFSSWEAQLYFDNLKIQAL